MVSKIIMVTFEITGVVQEGLFRSGCLLLHMRVIDSGEGGGGPCAQGQINATQREGTSARLS